MSHFHLLNELDKMAVRLDIKRLSDENNVLGNLLKPKSLLEMYFTLDLISYGEAFSPRKYSKVYKKLQLNQSIIFDWNYDNLSPDSCISITAWSSTKKYDPLHPLASTVISIFDQNDCLRQGKYHLFMWPDVLPDIDVPSTTPGLTDDPNIATLNFVADKKENMISQNIHDQRTEEALNIKLIYTYRLIPAAFLQVEFPKFPNPVFFTDKQSPDYEDFTGKNMNSVKAADFNDCFQVYDPDFEADRVDPLEETFYFLKRENGDNPEKAIPSKEESRTIDAIVNRTFKADWLKPKERELFIKYRYHLSLDKKHLIHYLHSVQWGTHQETEAIKILETWDRIDWIDALHLLSKEFSANSIYKKKSRSYDSMKIIRDYATEIISKLPDSKFIQILLQLIQTIRYDVVGDSSIVRLIIQKSLQDKQIAVFAYWYLYTEAEVMKEGKPTKNKEHTNTQNIQIYKNVYHQFCKQIKEKDITLWQMIYQQQKFIKYLRELSKIVKDSRDRQNEYRKRLAQKNWEQMGLIPFPLNISLVLKAPIPSECIIFSSAMAPFRLTFELANGGKFAFIYKNGDDLRQDQMILEIFALMDKILKKVNQDYKLTPYQALACSKSDGFVEFVGKTRTFQSTDLKEYVSQLVKRKPEAMDNYVASTAGYCAMTYFFMIGDRHLQNLLIDEEGKVFHIDFGFILGRDPKPYPPPIKISKEMIDAMGSSQQEIQQNFKKFKTKCLQAYLYLRKQAKLIFYLTTLMLDSGIKDVHPEGLSKLYDKFSLSLNDKQGQKYFLLVLQECRNALFPNITDKIHIWAAYFRK